MYHSFQEIWEICVPSIICFEASAQILLVRDWQVFFWHIIPITQVQLFQQPNMDKAITNKTVELLLLQICMQNISKNDKIYILAGLNKSFPGTQRKSRMSSCSTFLTNAIGQSVLINTALRSDSNYKGSRRIFISSKRKILSKPKFKFLAANIWGCFYTQPKVI